MLIELKLNSKLGLLLNLSFDQPSSSTSFWRSKRGENILQPNALCILLLNCGNDKRIPTIFVATVSSFGRRDFEQNRRRVETLHVCLESDDVVDIMKYIGKKSESNCEHILIEIESHLYSGENDYFLKNVILNRSFFL